MTNIRSSIGCQKMLMLARKPLIMLGRDHLSGPFMGNLCPIFNQEMSIIKVNSFLFFSLKILSSGKKSFKVCLLVAPIRIELLSTISLKFWLVNQHLFSPFTKPINWKLTTEVSHFLLIEAKMNWPPVFVVVSRDMTNILPKHPQNTR